MKKQTFLKTFLLFFLISTLSSIGLPKEKTVTSNWADIPLKIDGSYEDWQGETFNFEEKISVDYAFKNDGENLFIVFMFKDPKFLSSINATGMTLWFNLEGKKKKNYGIRFIKKKVSPDAFIAIVEKQKGPLSEREKNNIKANPHYFLHNAIVLGKKGKSGSQVSDTGESEQAVFRMMKQERGIVYEFVIPLKRATENALGVGTESGKVVKVGFEWGGVPPEVREAMIKRRAGQVEGTRPENPRVSGGSWSKGSSYGRGMPRVGKSPKKYSFWVDVQLAKNL